MHEPEKPKWNAGDMDKWPGNEQSTIKKAPVDQERDMISSKKYW